MKRPDKDTCKVQDRGQDGAHQDLGIRNAHDVRHEEGRGAHDRGHDLAARRSCRLDCSRKLRLIARLLHHGDRDRTGRDSITNGRAADHTAKSGGNDSDLGGSAGITACGAVCEVDEKFRDTGALKEGTEDNEDYYVLGTHVDRRRKDTGLGIKEVADQIP